MLIIVMLLFILLILLAKRPTVLRAMENEVKESNPR